MTSVTPLAVQVALTTASRSAQLRTWPVSLTALAKVSAATSLSSEISGVAGIHHIHGLRASDSSGRGVPAAMILSTGPGLAQVPAYAAGPADKPHICGSTAIRSRTCLRIHRGVTRTRAASIIPAAPNTPEAVRRDVRRRRRRRRLGTTGSVFPPCSARSGPGSNRRGGWPPDQRTVRASSSGPRAPRIAGAG